MGHGRRPGRRQELPGCVRLPARPRSRRPSLARRPSGHHGHPRARPTTASRLFPPSPTSGAACEYAPPVPHSCAHRSGGSRCCLPREGAGEFGGDAGRRAVDARRPRRLWHSAGHRPRSHCGDIRRVGQAGAGDARRAERKMMVESWRKSLASTLERRSGPRMVPFPPELSPAIIWSPAQAVAFTADARPVRSNSAHHRCVTLER